MSQFKFHNYPGYLEAAGDLDVYESETATVPHDIFHKGETMHFEFNWTQSGWVWQYLNAKEWVLNLYFELIGEGEAANIPPLPPVTFVQEAPHVYDPSRYPVPTNDKEAGTYRVTATIRLKDQTDNFMPFAGFCEGTMIEIY